MEKLSCMLILEIIGRPISNVTESLNTLVVKMGAEKGINVVKSTIHEPKPVEDAPDIFTSFAEVEVEFDSLYNYFGAIFAYMPAHIELINPESVTLPNSELNNMANALIQRLHGYDAIAKSMMNENNILKQNIQRAAPELFKKMFPNVEVKPEEPEKPAKKTKKKSKSKKKAKKK